MTDTTSNTATTATPTVATPTPASNYALYRTAAYKGQPAGYVIAAQMLTDPAKVSLPAGFAYALDAAKNYAVGSIYTPATDYTLTGATTATAGTALTLDLTPNNDGPTGDVTVTLSDGGAGGTFSSSTATFSGCTKTVQTVTYTPKAAGTVTISSTNSGSLTNPVSLSVTVSAAA